jgi:ankyrin repeat protein
MSDAPRELTSRSTHETIRRQAKRWLKEIEAGDAEAIARFRKLIPNHAAVPKLREVQHALARGYGLPNWAALKQELIAREAAARGHAALVALFLEKSALRLGVSPDAETRDGIRALHEAAGSDAIEIVALLIEAGAEIDPIERRYGSTPLGWARHQGASAAQIYLASRSRDIQALCEAAEIERLEALFAEEPALANTPARSGEPPLFCLPDDDASACDLVEFLLAAGADPAVRNAEGMTPAQAARKRGLLDAAALLAARLLPLWIPLRNTCGGSWWV